MMMNDVRSGCLPPLEEGRTECGYRQSPASAPLAHSGWGSGPRTNNLQTDRVDPHPECPLVFGHGMRREPHSDLPFSRGDKAVRGEKP